MLSRAKRAVRRPRRPLRPHHTVPLGSPRPAAGGRCAWWAATPCWRRRRPAFALLLEAGHRRRQHRLRRPGLRHLRGGGAPETTRPARWWSRCRAGPTGPGRSSPSEPWSGRRACRPTASSPGWWPHCPERPETGRVRASWGHDRRQGDPGRPGCPPTMAGASGRSSAVRGGAPGRHRAGVHRSYWDTKDMRAPTAASPAGSRCSRWPPSSTRAPAGPASGSRSTAIRSSWSATRATAWCAPRSAARDSHAWATSSTTVPDHRLRYCLNSASLDLDTDEPPA